MTKAVQLANRIVVCHRESGFLRLEVPAELCLSEPAKYLETGIKTLSGVTSVEIDTTLLHFVIRYDGSNLTTTQVARHLFNTLDQLPEAHGSQQSEHVQATNGNFLENGIQEILGKLKAVFIPPGELRPGSLRARFQPMLESAMTETAVINFFNDIVAFYLIKVHWDLITKRWLKYPVMHGNAWLTTFYLIFLLVRYRKHQ